MGRGSLDSFDPLSLAIAPPPDESADARAARLLAEAEAARISDEIDEQIKSERSALKKKKRPIKVLLVGQSESGKSTTLKNFQLVYARKAWTEERASWRAVIHLNLVRSVRTILDIITGELAGTTAPSTIADEDNDDATEPLSSITNLPRLSFLLTDKHKLLKLRLGPIRRIEKDLERQLGYASEEIVASDAITVAAPWSDSPAAARRPQEPFVRSTGRWKSALNKIRSRPSTSSRDEDRVHTGPSADETVEVIASCKDDIKALWEDTVVQDILKKRKIALEDSAGFFLHDVDRIACRNYEPTDDDVLRARLRTLGVQEYRFQLERGSWAQSLGSESGREWVIYDVGGIRTSRATWYPYFDDVNAIIFLAPISCFDEKLAEDRRVNRLQDSFALWESICSSKFLSRTQLILFLNKCDLLDRKLKRGVRVRDHVPSFENRSNDVDSVALYFRHKFKDISKQHSPEPRPFYVYLTSVIDTNATAATLGVVREGIIRSYLQSADFL